MRSLILSLLLTATCAAQEVGGVYRLVTDVVGKPQQSDVGSCVGISTADKRQHFLTVQHVTGPQMRIEHNGREYPCELVETWDAEPEPVCLIRTVEPVQFKVYELHLNHNLSVGDAVCVVGFPQGKYGRQFTRVQAVENASDGTILTSQPIEHGYSGGAILAPGGKLVGLVSGSESRRGVSLNLLDVVRRIRSEPEKVIKVQWRCMGGFCRPMYCQPSAPVYRTPPRQVVAKPVQRLSVDLSGVEGRIAAMEQRLAEMADRGTVTPTELQSVHNLLTIDIERVGKQNADLQQRVEALESLLRQVQGDVATIRDRKRTVILKDGGVEVDREEYLPTEPIVLDLKAITKK